MSRREKRLRFVYVIGVEGCGHHGLYPVLAAAIAAHERARCGEAPLPPMLGRWGPLRRIFDALWYEAPDAARRRALLDELDALMERVRVGAAGSPGTAWILEDNSFPSGDHRSTARQWDVADMAEIMAPHADVRFIALYRDPRAMTFSHPDFDGGLRSHARVVAEFLEWLNGVLERLGRDRYRVVRYEDLMARDPAMTAMLAAYLDLPPACFEEGFQALRPSGKDWRRQLPPGERDWLADWFNEARLARWPNFLPQPGKNSRG